VGIKDSNKEVQTEISKYLDSKVDNVRSSAKVIEGTTIMICASPSFLLRVDIRSGHKNMVSAQFQS
jgi:hypothetical protein